MLLYVQPLPLAASASSTRSFFAEAVQHADAGGEECRGGSVKAEVKEAPLKKRLRKKLHKGEFAVFGFHIEFLTKEKLAWGDDQDGPGTVFSDALEEWSHERGYCLAPGGDGKWWGCFVLPYRENKSHPGLTKDGRDAILQHVLALPEVDAMKVVVGPLTNAYEDDPVMWREFCRVSDENLGARA